MSRSFFLLLVCSLLGCVNMPTTANANNWIIDDGVIELTPEYTVQHTQGEPHIDVYAAFTFIPEKKLVQLRASDAITVNGYALHGSATAQGYFYKARIPTTEGSLVFSLTRAPNFTLTHSFELPALKISELPKVYRPYETLRVPVEYVEPPPYVKETYDISIYGGGFGSD